ncbi:MAG: DinB family protein [Armatimonadetes bacterium]|nr:DinB family protein [Armatimonadota bacterium]
MEALIETWNIHARINHYLLEALDDAQLDAKLAKGRTARAMFAHIHNVRLMWFKSARADLLEGLEKLEADSPKETILGEMAKSDRAVEKMLMDALEGDQRVRGFKPHAQAYIGYLISHESHHRGQVEIMLRLAGLPISDKVSFGLWEWGTR